MKIYENVGAREKLDMEIIDLPKGKKCGYK